MTTTPKKKREEIEIRVGTRFTSGKVAMIVLKKGDQDDGHWYAEALEEEKRAGLTMYHERYIRAHHEGGAS